jgi:hypothetical protein
MNLIFLDVLDQFMYGLCLISKVLKSYFLVRVLQVRLIAALSSMLLPDTVLVSETHEPVAELHEVLNLCLCVLTGLG